MTIRERVRDVLLDARPRDLSMSAISGSVTGPWRERDVQAVVRRLWELNELGRRGDGTYVLTEKVPGSADAPAPTRRRRSKLDIAVARVAAEGRREGHSSKVRTRTVDPGLLSAFCPRCRASVRPLLDGSCPTCATQTGANVDEARKPRRRRRRKPLRKDQPGFGTICSCGAPKSKQAHTCRRCGSARRVGRQLGPRPTHRPAKNISDELLLEARRLYASGLSIRQVAERIYPQTGYASLNACKTSLFSLFKTRGWRLRPQSEVTAARNFRHGRKARGLTRERDLAYRRWLMAQRGWSTFHGPGRPQCKGVKRQAPGRGGPCPRRALEDSEYCYSHDPRYELERQAHLARSRAKSNYREPLLPAGPFTAWLAGLRDELGGWREVGQLIGADGSAVHRWGTGRCQRVAVRVIRRSAENAGTSLEAIYGGAQLAEAA